MGTCVCKYSIPCIFIVFLRVLYTMVKGKAIPLQPWTGPGQALRVAGG